MFWSNVEATKIAEDWRKNCKSMLILSTKQSFKIDVECITRCSEIEKKVQFQMFLLVIAL